MFRRTDPQATFGSLNVLLTPEKIARLEKNHWAGSFRRKAFPVLLANEPIFRSLFCEDNGRPNKPVAATLGVLILKETFDLTDEAALDNFEFNASWQYALDVDPEENPMQVVTHVSMEGAHQSDQHASVPVIDDLEQKGCKPDTLLADTNYGRGRNIVDAAARGIDLVTPSWGPKPAADEACAKNAESGGVGALSPRFRRSDSLPGASERPPPA